MYAFGSAEKGQLGNGDTGERLATGQRVVFGIETVPRMYSTYPPPHKSDADRARFVTLPRHTYSFYLSSHQRACESHHRGRLRGPATLYRHRRCRVRAARAAYLCIASDSHVPPYSVVFVWGYNGYCRLGLGDQKDRLKPVVVPHVGPLGQRCRRMQLTLIFQFAGPKEISMGLLVTAGPTNSVVVDKQGVYYMAGKVDISSLHMISSGRVD